MDWMLDVASVQTPQQRRDSAEHDDCTIGQPYRRAHQRRHDQRRRCARFIADHEARRHGTADEHCRREGEVKATTDHDEGEPDCHDANDYRRLEDQNPIVGSKENSGRAAAAITNKATAERFGKFATVAKEFGTPDSRNLQAAD